jgi:hypothetical protein
MIHKYSPESHSWVYMYWKAGDRSDWNAFIYKQRHLCLLPFCVRNEEVLLREKKQRNILHEIRKRKANWIVHILRRNCLLQRVTEGKIQGGIEVTGRRRRRRRRKLLDDLQERRGYSHLKEEALGRTICSARFGRGFGPVVRQTTKWMNEIHYVWLLYGIIRHPQHTQTCSISSTIAADSNNGVTNIRCCRYSCLRSWWWYHPKHVDQFPDKINYVTLHLVGYTLEYHYDARTHER